MIGPVTSSTIEACNGRSSGGRDSAGSGIGATLYHSLQGKGIDIHPHILVFDIENVSHIQRNYKIGNQNVS
jgi:hypothetical protein